MTIIYHTGMHTIISQRPEVFDKELVMFFNKYDNCQDDVINEHYKPRDWLIMKVLWWSDKLYPPLPALLCNELYKFTRLCIRWHFDVNKYNGLSCSHLFRSMHAIQKYVMECMQMYWHMQCGIFLLFH